jgi:DNA-binding GntR family transcriptional regulator
MAYDSLRADILSGRVSPGSKLPFAELVERYECSIGALREALQRLTVQGLVESEVQQGFRVVSISADDLIDLTTARCEIEVLALRYAIRDGDVAWEASAVAAHHMLERAPQFDQADPGRFSDDWAVAHGKFHEALLSGCGNRRILSTACTLRDSAELYRLWSVPLGHDHDRDIAGEHKAILDATISRDPDTAGRLLAAHIQRTTDKLLVTLGHPPSGPEPTI